MFRLIDRQEDFVVIDKAPNVAFHRGEEETGLFDALRAELAVDQVFAVHRLDAMTSGLLLIATRADSAAALAAAFREGRVEKRYVALSDRTPKKKQGWVRGDMAASRRGQWKLLPTQTHPAITRFTSAGTGEGRRLFLLKPITGRTHQLRVALKSVGAPILGDPLYHADDAANQRADRGYLHATALGFSLAGHDYRYFCPPTIGEYFLSTGTQTALARLGHPLDWVG